jgi:hypothetical protein
MTVYVLLSFFYLTENYYSKFLPNYRIMNVAVNDIKMN